MKAEDLKKMLIGKTIKEIETRSYDDVTCIEFEGYCDFAAICNVSLPNGDTCSVDPPEEETESHFRFRFWDK